MKKAFTLIILLFAVSAFAQTERKSWHLGGGVNISFNTSEYEFVPTGVHLQQGYLLKKNLLLGLNLSYNFFAMSSIQSGDPFQLINSKKRYTNIPITPFIRQFMGNGEWRPYIEGQAGIIYQSVKQLYNDPTKNLTLVNGYYKMASLGFGFAYFPKKNWGLDIGINYNFIEKSQDNTFWSSPVSLKIGLRNIISKK